MCLRCQIGYEILRKDTVVKKLCVLTADGIYSSIFNKFQFKKGENIPHEYGKYVNDEKGGVYEAGFHCYTEDKKDNEIFDAHRYMIDRYPFTNYVIVKFIIPERTKILKGIQIHNDSEDEHIIDIVIVTPLIILK